MYVSVDETPTLAEQVKTVKIDGEDVTMDCFIADSDAGYVMVYRRDATGQFAVAPNEQGDLSVVFERRDGAVEISL